MSRMTLAENIATRRTFWPLVELTPQSRASGGYLSFIYHENSISYQDTVPGVCMAYPVHLPTQYVTHWTLLCTWTSRHEQKLLCVSASEILFFGSFLSDGPPRASGVVWTWVSTTVKSEGKAVENLDLLLRLTRASALSPLVGAPSRLRGSKAQRTSDRDYLVAWPTLGIPVSDLLCSRSDFYVVYNQAAPVDHLFGLAH